MKKTAVESLSSVNVYKNIREHLVRTSVPDTKHFGTDPDPEFDLRTLRFRILTCFQNVAMERTSVLQIFDIHKK